MNQLAIVIPYYKIDFFEQTLKSLSNQTDKRFTLYIGNDASPVNPLSVIEKYFPIDSIHYYNYEKNLGKENLALQWERIVENVKEDWFQILGDDDMVADNFVQAFYESVASVNENNLNVIKVSQFWINEKGEQITKKIFLSNKTPSSKEYFIKKLEGTFLSSLSEHIFRTKVHHKIKFRKLPLAWGSDDLAVLEYSNFGNFYFIDNTSVLVRVSGVSITGSEDDTSTKNKKFKTLEKIYAFALYNFKNKFSLNERKAILKAYFFFCWKEKKIPSLSLSRIYLDMKDYKNFMLVPKKRFTFFIHSLKK